MADDKTLQDLEGEVVKIARGAVQKAVLDSLAGYNSPLSKAVTLAFQKHEPEFVAVVEREIGSLAQDHNLALDIREALRHKLASILVSKVGGEIEKRVNDLRQNPETRARITLALAKMIDEL